MMLPCRMETSAVDCLHNKHQHGPLPKGKRLRLLSCDNIETLLAVHPFLISILLLSRVVEYYCACDVVPKVFLYCDQ